MLAYGKCIFTTRQPLTLRNVAFTGDNSMKKFLRKQTQRTKLGKEQKKFLADICKTLAITGFILPAIANQFFPQISINIGLVVFMVFCGIVLILTGIRFLKQE